VMERSPDGDCRLRPFHADAHSGPTAELVAVQRAAPLDREHMTEKEVWAKVPSTRPS
jgi:hypothetical protein